MDTTVKSEQEKLKNLLVDCGIVRVLVLPFYNTDSKKIRYGLKGRFNDKPKYFPIKGETEPVLFDELNEVNKFKKMYNSLFKNKRNEVSNTIV